MNNIVHVLLCSTKSYVAYCAVTLVSIFENNKHLNIHIHLITGDMEESDIDKLRNLSHIYNQSLSFYCPQEFLLKSLEGIGHYHISAYYRLLAPELLPTVLNKVIYFDIDLIVRGSLENIWNSLDAVGDDSIPIVAARDVVRVYDYSRLHIDHTIHSYFNSGVMVINLNYWRKYNVMQNCIAYITKYPRRIIYADQDALNAVLCGLVKYIHPKYNCLTFYFAKKQYLTMKVWYNDLTFIDEAVKDPVVIHFSGDKPWFKGNDDLPYKKEWMNYLSMTEWKDIPIKYKNGFKGLFLNKIKNLVFRILGKFGNTFRRMYPVSYKSL